MTFLAAYRQQLADEAAGRSRRFADILRLFRVVWLASAVLGLCVAGWFIWTELRAPGPGGGWGLIIGPFLAMLIMLAGRVPYGLAQLFLSVNAERNG